MTQPEGGRREPVLVTGASGYIGGRLVPRLLDAGHRVRCLARSPEKLETRPWASDPRVEIVRADIGDSDLAASLRGCSSAFYLVHSMLAAGREYADEDLRLARNFARAAEVAGLRRVLYLGGLGETGANLSEHLSSRREVESALAGGSAEVTVLRAAMIIGAGSASFEILRYLVERLPMMVTPRWVSTACQPIAVDNVLNYLVMALENPATSGLTLDIGGPEVRSYSEIMQTMAQCLGLRRRVIVPLPVLTPRLSSLWIHLVTPISRHIARPLAEGLRNPVVARSTEVRSLMPQELLTIEQAIRSALTASEGGSLLTSWSDAGPILGDPDWAGGTHYIDQRATEVAASPASAFRAVCRIGGTNGWYAANFLWKVRGWIDRLVGGPGLRRGRRDSNRLRFGDALDFWRVVRIEQDRRLELRAEMRLPGIATLEFRLEPTDSPGLTGLVQIARFKPRGLLGILYWFAVYPLHGVVFQGMLNGVRKSAEEIEALSS